LALVWRRVTRYHIAFIAADGQVVVVVGDEAPDFFVAVDAVKDEISVFVLAVGSGTNIVLGTPVERCDVEDRGKYRYLSYQGETP
jgi:hypothetical protein